MNYETPMQPKDQWVANQWKKLGLGSNPSMKEVETKAKELLGRGVTGIIPATEVILARSVDSSEKDLFSPLFQAQLAKMPVEEQFGLLLMIKAIDGMEEKDSI